MSVDDARGCLRQNGGLGEFRVVKSEVCGRRRVEADGDGVDRAGEWLGDQDEGEAGGVD